MMKMKPGLAGLWLALTLSGGGLIQAHAQDFNAEKAARAKAYFTNCAQTAQGDAAQEVVISVCKSAINEIAGLFSAYPDYTPADLNILAVYSGAAAYVVVATDLNLNGNRLSMDGCNHADHVVNMYDRLTAVTNEQVETQLSQNAESTRSILIPWCNEAYPVE